MKVSLINKLPLLWNSRLSLLLFSILLAIFLINSLHFSYPDEFENIMGGYFINHGILPYTGFFTHHTPFAYFFASIITIFSGASFVKFRIILAIAYFLIAGAFYLFLKRSLGKKEARIYLVFTSLITIGATYFWGHMLLADSLVGYLLIPVYILLFFTTLKNKSLKFSELSFISILTALTILTSMTFSYAIIIIYAYTIYYYFYKSSRLKLPLDTLKLSLLLAAPYIAFLVYLLATGSLQEFYYQAIFFTKEYYATMPDGSGIRNPIRYALVLLSGFLDQYRAALVMSKDLNFSSPYTSSLALSNLFLILYLIINKRFKESLFVTALLIYLNGRGGPLTMGDTDYQSIPYQYFSMFNGIYLLVTLWENLKEKVEENKKIIYTFFFILLGAYYLFLTTFLFNRGFEKGYKKYMGTQSTIYDRPAVANTLNSLLYPGDYFYIGPFGFEDLLYTKGKLATKYIVTIPAMDKSEKIKQELINDMQNNKPKIVIFNTEYSIFGKTPGTFLVSYIKDNYFNLEQLKVEGLNYSIKTKFYGDYDFERHFFFDKTRKAENIQLLIDKGLLHIN